MTQLHYDATGQGAPLVFLHGLGTSSWMWAPQVTELAADFTCITIDLPNSGASHAQVWHDFERTADQVAAVLRGLDQPAHVVGLSLGGYVALRLLERHPDLVASCITTGASVVPLMPGWAMGPLSHLISRAVRWQWLGRLSARMMGLDPDSKAAYLSDLAHLRAPDVRRIYQQVNAFALAPLPPHVAQKLLFVSGEKEAKAILRSVEQIKSANPLAQTGIADGMHHAWSAQDPDRFNAMIRDWTQSRKNPFI